MNNLSVEGHKLAERIADKCLSQTNIGTNTSLKSQIIAYVDQQYKCEKQVNLKECKKARKLVLNLIYGDLSNQNAYEMQKWLIIINNKSKTCDNAEELMKYCENIGIRTNICESIQ